MLLFPPVRYIPAKTNSPLTLGLARSTRLTLRSLYSRRSLVLPYSAQISTCSRPLHGVRDVCVRSIVVHSRVPLQRMATSFLVLPRPVCALLHSVALMSKFLVAITLRSPSQPRKVPDCSLSPPGRHRYWRNPPLSLTHTRALASVGPRVASPRRFRTTALRADSAFNLQFH